jgi:hypothetical protein
MVSIFFIVAFIPTKDKGISVNYADFYFRKFDRIGSVRLDEDPIQKL